VLQSNGTLAQNVFAIRVFQFLSLLLSQSFFFPIGFQQQPFFFLSHSLHFTAIDESSHSARGIATQTRVEDHQINKQATGCSVSMAGFPSSYWTLGEQ
jgi:hypothetical protein